MSFVTTAAVIGAGTSLYGAYNASQGHSGSSGGAPQQNPYLNANTMTNLGGQMTGNYTGNIGNSLFGSFDQGAFFNANPEALRQYQEAIASGGLQGWTPQQFAQAYIGAPGNNPSIGSSTNGAGPLNSYNSGGLLQQVGLLQPQLNAINQQANPGLTALQGSLTNQALNGMPQNQGLGAFQSFLGIGGNQGGQQTFSNGSDSIGISESPQQGGSSGANPFSGGYTAGNYQAQQFDPTSLFSNNSFAAQNVRAPQGNSLLNQLQGQAMQNQGPSQIQQQQNQIASGLLAQGGGLSNQEQNSVIQQTRGAFGARGLDDSNSAIAAEALNTDAAQRARLQQNLGIAQGVQTQGLAEQNQQQQFGLGVGSQLYGYGQLGLQGQIANQGANLQAQGLGLQQNIANQGFGLNSFNANSNASYNAANMNQQAQQFQAQQQQQAAAMQAQALFQAAGLDQQQNQQNLQAQQLALQGNLATYNPITSTDLFSLGNQIAGTSNSNLNDVNNTNFNAQYSTGINNQNQNAAFNNGLMNIGGGLVGGWLQQGGGAGGYNGLFGGGPTAQPLISSYYD